jgi:hypothetical protein
MAQASARLVRIAEVSNGAVTETELFDHVGSIGKSVLDVVDANRGTNDPVTIHDFMTLLNNQNITDEQLPIVLRKLDTLRDANRQFLPGISTKPGPTPDGSTRYIKTLAGTPNSGVNFEAIAAVYVRDQLGEQVVGMGARAFTTAPDGTKVFLFEGDVNSISPHNGLLKLWDAKNVNGQSSLTAAKVTNAKNAVLQGAQAQLGSNVYTVGEAGFAIEAGGSISPDVQVVIDAANQELIANGFPPLHIVQNIPFQ